MAYSAALAEGELFKLNLREVRGWIDANRRRIKARPNGTWLYAGLDLSVAEALPPGDRREFVGTPMWKRIEKMRGELAARKLPCEFQTLEDVLKATREHPRVIDRDRREQRFANAYEFFEQLPRLAKLLPDPRGLARECWDRLSEAFAANAEGDIRILDGAAEDHGRLREDKVLLRKELDALLRNDRLSPAAKALLLKKVEAYGTQFDRRHTELIRRLQEDRERLSGRRRT